VINTSTSCAVTRVGPVSPGCSGLDGRVHPSPTVQTAFFLHAALRALRQRPPDSNAAQEALEQARECHDEPTLAAAARWAWWAIERRPRSYSRVIEELERALAK